MAAARQGSLTKESGSPGYLSPVFVLADRQEGLPHDSVSCHLEGYPLKETAQYVTGGEVVKTFNAMAEKMFHGAATANGPSSSRRRKSSFPLPAQTAGKSVQHNGRVQKCTIS